jgi:hypothetical protein
MLLTSKLDVRPPPVRLDEPIIEVYFVLRDNAVFKQIHLGMKHQIIVIIRFVTETIELKILLFIRAEGV